MRIVVIGAGHAGVELAAALRQKGFAGPIDLISDDPALPYQRPPLSKEYIKRPGIPLVLKPAQFYADRNVTLHSGVRAEAIDRAGRTVSLSDGNALSYDHLVIATGARNRRPPVPGLDHPAIVELRSEADAARLAGRIGSWGRIAIVGGGFIGLEAAGLLAQMGVQTHVVEMAPRLLARAVSPTVSDWLLAFHRRQGVHVHTGEQVAAIAHRDHGASVMLSGGDAIDADAVMLAAGVMANDEIAAAAGLEVGNGIVVDAMLATADPAISAIGDCARYPSVHYPGMVRLESVQNANDQARALAARLTGTGKPYDALPWFWSIQGDARLQIAGLSKAGMTEVMRGDPASGQFSVFLFEAGRLRAVESINSPGDHMMARQLIASGAKLDPSAISDTSGELRHLLARK